MYLFAQREFSGPVQIVTDFHIFPANLMSTQHVALSSISVLIVSFRSEQKHFCSVSNSHITTDVISQLQQLIVASLLPIYTVRWFEAFEIPSSARNYDNSISCDSWMIRVTSQLNFQMETLTYRLIWFEVTNWVRNWNSISQNIQNSLEIPSNWRHS